MSVDWIAVDGTDAPIAVSETDYLPNSGTLTWNPGESEALQAGPVTTMGPGLGRTFTIQLQNPVNCMIDPDNNIFTVQLIAY
jgi:hypothetical protein